MGELFSSESNLDILSFLEVNQVLSLEESVSLFREIVSVCRSVFSDDTFLTPLSLEHVVITKDQLVSIQLGREGRNYEYPLISPECTDLLNWPVQHSTNLYVVGLCGYLLLNGKPPLYSQNYSLSFNWTYDVPSMLRSIVEKLLSWYPDDRYQTYDGLLFDLNTCCEEIIAGKEIEPFMLAKCDVSTRLNFPAYLYGRDEDMSLLKHAFESSQDSTHIVFLGGYSGVGKTTLVRQFLNDISDDNVLVLCGKCEQFSSEPYASFASALKDFVGSEALKRDHLFAEQLHGYIAPNGAVLVDFLPEFDVFFSREEKPKELSADTVKSRLRQALGKLFHFMASKWGRVILFLDDMQWGDELTMHIVLDLIKDELPVMVICAYRDNECATPHVIKEYRKYLGCYGPHFTDHHLSSLRKEDLEIMLGDLFQQHVENIDELLHFMYQCTRGNPLFSRELLQELVQEKILVLDCEKNQWKISTKLLQSKHISKNVAELVSNRMGYLDRSIKEVLMPASLLGFDFDMHDLICVSGQGAEYVERILYRAELAECIVKKQNGVFAFIHDSVQKGFYQLFSHDERLQKSRELAVLLIDNWSLSRPEEDIPSYMIALYNLGSDSIANEQEYARLVTINVDYIHRLIHKAAFEEGFEMIEKTWPLIEKASSLVCDDLKQELVMLHIKVAYICGCFDVADKLVQNILDDGQSLELKLEALNMKVLAYQSNNQFDVALESSRYALTLLCVSTPKMMTLSLLKEHVNVFFSLLFSRFSFHRLSPVKHVLDAWTLTFIIHAGLACWFSGRARWVTYYVVRGINYMFKKGATPESSFILSAFALHYAFENKLSWSHHYHKEALALSEKYNSHIALSRVKYVFAAFILFWQAPYEECFKVLEDVIDECRDIGNDATKMYAIVAILDLYFEAGVSMQTIRDQVESSRRLLDMERRESVEKFNSFGLFQNFLFFDDYAQSIQSGKEGAYSLQEGGTDFDMYTLKLLKCAYYYTYKKFELGQEVLDSFDTYKEDFKVGNFIAFYHFLNGLYSAQLGSNRKKESLAILNVSIRLYKKWAARNPANFSAKLNVLQGEYNRIKGKYDCALSHYNQAIMIAFQQCAYHVAGISAERAYEVSCELQDDVKTKYYLRQAVQGFGDWGAIAKMEQLKDQILATASTT